MVEDLVNQINDLIVSYKGSKRISNAFSNGYIIEKDMLKSQKEFIDECKYYLEKYNYSCGDINTFEDVKNALNQIMPNLVANKDKLQEEISNLTIQLKKVNNSDDFYSSYLGFTGSDSYSKNSDLELQLNTKKAELEKIELFEYYKSIVDFNDVSKAKNSSSSILNDIMKYKDRLMNILMDDLVSKVNHLEEVISNPELLKNELLLQGHSISELSNSELSRLAISYYIEQYNNYYNTIVKTYYKVLYKINSLQAKPMFDEDELDDFLNNITDILNNKIKSSSIILKDNITKSLISTEKLYRFTNEKDSLSSKKGYFTSFRLNYLNKNIVKLQEKIKKYKVSRQSFILKHSVIFIDSFKISKAAKEINGAKEIKRTVKDSIGEINSSFNSSILSLNNSMENDTRTR